MANQTYVEKLEDTQKDLSAYFDKSAESVRGNFDRFEKHYARPAYKYSVDSFEAYPLTSTFAAIFTLLGFLPVISFIGFSLFVIASILFLALFLALVAIVVVEVVFVTILLTTLLTLVTFSAFLTPVAASAFLTFRLLILVRDDGSVKGGMSSWVGETKGRLVKEKERVKEQVETEGSEGSSAILINSGEGDESEASGNETVLKVEGEY